MKFKNFHIVNNNTEYYYNNSLIYFRTTNYFYCYIISILILYEFWFSYGYIITRFLITATFCGAVLIRCSCLIWGGAYLRPAFMINYPSKKKVNFDPKLLNFLGSCLPSLEQEGTLFLYPSDTFCYEKWDITADGCAR